MDRHPNTPVGARVPIRAALFAFFLFPSVFHDQVRAEPAPVRFDAPETAACREIAPDEPARASGGEKLVELAVPVSTLVRSAAGESLVQCMIGFHFPERTVRVVDYWPKTELQSDVVENVTVERRDEKTSSIGLSAAGRYDHLVEGTASGALGSKKADVVKYQMKPARQLLSAAGTMSRGSGVYFKLRPSSQTTLEGSRSFRLVLRVPGAWRADYMRLSCRADGVNRLPLAKIKTKADLGRADFLIGLYLENDQDAQSAATHLVESERRLRELAAARFEAVALRQYPSALHKFGSLVSLVEPKIPDTWLTETISARAAASNDAFHERLPDDVARASSTYTSAKRAVYRLSVAKKKRKDPKAGPSS